MNLSTAARSSSTTAAEAVPPPEGLIHIPTMRSSPAACSIAPTASSSVRVLRGVRVCMSKSVRGDMRGESVMSSAMSMTRTLPCCTLTGSTSNE